jgi:ssRNA-specific RNase YbeY (16S rRNA maturation enzyme)
MVRILTSLVLLSLATMISTFHSSCPYSLKHRIDDCCRIGFIRTNFVDGLRASRALVLRSGQFYSRQASTFASGPTLSSPHGHIFKEKVGPIRSEIVSKSKLSLSVASHVDNADSEDIVRIDVRTEDIEFEPIANLKRDAVDLVTAALFHDSEPSDTELSIVLCSDDFIQNLNSQWRDKNQPTDVLSFPQEDDAEVVLGDLVISIPTATRQVCSQPRSCPTFLTLIAPWQGGRERAGAQG